MPLPGDEQKRQEGTITDRSIESSNRALGLSRTGSTSSSSPKSDQETSDPLIGSIFQEQYEIMSVLGQGGMSIVYLARHLALNRLRAIKLLHTHLTGRDISFRRFHQEAQSVSSLSHPGIVTVHDYDVTSDGIPYLIMDYLQGESLQSLIEREGYLKPAQAISIFMQTCDALAHAHALGVVHRDLKPSNIMLIKRNDGTYSAKVVDFGVAKLLGEQSATPSRLTQTGDFVGSPFYMSPEQCQGRELDARSDIYSMGCVMFETLTGQLAFSADSIYGVMFKHTHDIAPSIGSIRPELAKLPTLGKIVVKSLAKDPSRRYQSMDALGMALAEINVSTAASALKHVLVFFEILRINGQAIRVVGTWILAAIIVALIGVLIMYPRSTLAQLNLCSKINAPLPLICPKYPLPRPLQQIDDMDWQMQKGKRGVALQMDERLKDQDLEHRARELEGFGVECLYYGKYDEGEPALKRSVYLLLQCKQEKACIDQSLQQTSLRTDYTNLGECLYRQSKYNEASQSYARRNELDRKIMTERSWLKNWRRYYNALLLQADCLYRLQNFPETYRLLSSRDLVSAVQDSTTDLTENQNQVPLFKVLYYTEFADSAYRLKKYESAEAHYLAALAGRLRFHKIGDPEDDSILMVRTGLARTYDEDGKLDQARKQYEQVWQAAAKHWEKNSDEIMSAALRQYSDFLISHSTGLTSPGDVIKAVEVFNKAKEYRAHHV